MDEIRENLKKLLYAGVGAVTVTVDKARDVLDDLAEKGAETVEKGKACTAGWTETVSRKIDELVPHAPKTPEEIEKWLDGLSAEERATVLKKIIEGMGNCRS